jgi:hypothetical protein
MQKDDFHRTAEATHEPNVNLDLIVHTKHNLYKPKSLGSTSTAVKQSSNQA